MNAARSTFLKCLASVCLTIAALPASSFAQQAGRGGAGGAAQMPQMLQQVLGQLDLSADQKTKIDGMLRQAQQDLRSSMQGLQDATPEERMQKMQDMQKAMADTRTKVEAELTPEQKAKYFPLVASTGLKYSTDLLAALKTAAGKADMTDDQKKQVGDVFDDAGKSIEGMKSDAAAVKDDETATDFQQKLTKAQMDTRKQLVDILGQDDARKLMQAAQQSMRGSMGRAGRNGANGAANGGAATQPAAK
jgi:Spy/CpxP family protein refolding chaperone